MSKTLLAGPWIGEFGWELFHWQGFIRSISRQFDRTIIVGRKGHDVLYEDFSDGYIEFDPKSYQTDGWRCKNSVDHLPLIRSINHDRYVDGTTFDTGCRYTEDGVVDTNNSIKWSMQSFFNYSNSCKLWTPYDIVLHARHKHSGERSSERNWSIDKWNELSSRLKHLSIASIGTTQSSLHVNGTDDCRDLPLRDVISLICCSKIVVGPSSGPMHLASLCGVSHLVWSSPYNRNRYETSWNPHNTTVYFHDNQGWDPSVDNILNIINNVI